MAKPTKPGNLSRKLLMGVAVASLPLAGCTVESNTGASGQNTGVTATADEAALYRQASQQGSTAAAENFLQTYPRSNLARSLLIELPPTTLGQISDGTIDRLNPNMLDSLPFRVRLALGLTTRSTGEGGSPDDGYSG